MSGKKSYKILATILFMVPLSSTASAQQTTGKAPSNARISDAIQADAFFWEVFHNGQYAQIPAVLNALTSAFLADPSDAETAAHIGFTHTWRLNERWRQPEFPPTITDDASVAKKYFEDAVRLNPKDKRYLAFLGAFSMAEGDLHADRKLMRKGYSILNKVNHIWPEFGYVAAGITITGDLMRYLPSPASPLFKRALEWQWKTIDLCVGAKIDRDNPDVSPYVHLATTEGPKRVCWNGTIAPHNFEGFYMHMGDMLVKAGDWHTGQKIYANARLSPTYSQWQYKEALEQRIAQAKANVALFNAPPVDRTGRIEHPEMTKSAFACVVCHQN